MSIRILDNRYYGICKAPNPQFSINPFDDKIIDNNVYVCRCGREGCTNVEIFQEKISKPSFMDAMIPNDTDISKELQTFPRCPKCFTKYCSQKCLLEDHKSGYHKEKCEKFIKSKEYQEKVLCAKCWKQKWNIMSDICKEGKRSPKQYIPCHKCIKKEYSMENNISKDLSDDSDIRNVWF